MRLVLRLAFIFLAACTTMPLAVRDVQVVAISYQQASQNIDSYQDAPVRWGGVIIDVENEEDYSLVQVLYYPLDNYGRPQFTQPEGRFVVKSPEFLDPAIYTSGREITAVGLIDGTIERTVGKKTIIVPLITSTTIHLWPAGYRYSQDYYHRYPVYRGNYRWYPDFFGRW